eukprot:9089875-Pyramimonas_sp.AAC.1
MSAHTPFTRRSAPPPPPFAGLLTSVWRVCIVGAWGGVCRRSAAAARGRDPLPAYGAPLRQHRRPRQVARVPPPGEGLCRVRVLPSPPPQTGRVEMNSLRRRSRLKARATTPRLGAGATPLTCGLGYRVEFTRDRVEFTRDRVEFTSLRTSVRRALGPIPTHPPGPALDADWARPALDADWAGPSSKSRASRVCSAVVILIRAPSDFKGDA